MEDKDDDLVREFFAAVRSRPCGAVISLIEANPGLICSVEDADSGDTALHVAVKACRSGDVYMANMHADGWTNLQCVPKFPRQVMYPFSQLNVDGSQNPLTS